MAENSDNQEVVKLDEQTYQYLYLDGNNFKYLYLINYQLISVILKRVDIRNTEIKNKLFYDDYDGLECEVLKPGAQSWQKGKIKVELNVKFYPDEPEEEIEEKESSQLENEVFTLNDLRRRFN